jgi:hypothetical protein
MNCRRQLFSWQSSGGIDGAENELELVPVTKDLKALLWVPCEDTELVRRLLLITEVMVGVKVIYVVISKPQPGAETGVAAVDTERASTVNNEPTFPRNILSGLWEMIEMGNVSKSLLMVKLVRDAAMLRAISESLQAYI